MHTVYITKIIRDWDMRGTYELLEHAHIGSLEQNEVMLAINRRRTMVRFIDMELGVHTYYSPVGQRFDLAALKSIATAAIGIRLESRAKLKLKRAA